MCVSFECFVVESQLIDQLRIGNEEMRTTTRGDTESDSRARVKYHDGADEHVVQQFPRSDLMSEDEIGQLGMDVVFLCLCGRNDFVPFVPRFSFTFRGAFRTLWLLFLNRRFVSASSMSVISDDSTVNWNHFIELIGLKSL